jgi:hypothetical protein
VEPRVGVPGGDSRSTATFSVPQPEREIANIRNNQGIFLTISSSEQDWLQEYIFSTIREGPQFIEKNLFNHLLPGYIRGMLPAGYRPVTIL